MVNLVKEGLNSERPVSHWVRTLKSILLHNDIVFLVVVSVGLASATWSHSTHLTITTKVDIGSVVPVLLKDVSPLILEFDPHQTLISVLGLSLLEILSLANSQDCLVWDCHYIRRCKLTLVYPFSTSTWNASEELSRKTFLVKTNILVLTHVRMLVASTPS